MKNTPLTIAALVLLLLSGIYLGRSCGHDDRTIAKSDKAVVDSLGDLLDRTRKSEIVFVDSVYTETLAKDSIIRANEVERAALKARVMVASKMSDHYADLYFEAQAAKDTAAMLVSCDSAIQSMVDLETAARDEIAAADSTVAMQKDQLATKDTLIMRLRMDNTMLYNAGKAIEWKYDDLYNRYRKKTNWFHRWGLPVITGVAGGLLIHSLTK